MDQEQETTAGQVARIPAAEVAAKMLEHVPLGPALAVVERMRDRVWRDMLPSRIDPATPLGQQLIDCADVEARLLEIETALRDCSLGQP